MEKYEEDNFFDNSEFRYIFKISSGILVAYLGAALNQIPNVPENGNLRKEYEHTFEDICNGKLSNKTKYLQQIERVDELQKLDESKLIEDLVTIIGAMNQDTKYLYLNYQQMLNNRLIKFDLSEKRIQEIHEKKGKPITKDEKRQLLQVSVMQDVSNYLHTMYELRSGMKSDLQLVMGNNKYLQVTKNNDLKKNLIDLLNAGEKSFVEIINYERGETHPKIFGLLNPDIMYFDENGKSDRDFYLFSISNQMPHALFGDEDLCKCLVMELFLQKSLNEYLGKLAVAGHDVNAILAVVQEILIEKETALEAKRNFENTKKQNIMPLQQTAGKTSNHEASKKKTQFIQKFMKLKGTTQNQQEQGK